MRRDRDLFGQEFGGVARECLRGAARPRERAAECTRDLHAGDVAECAREGRVDVRRVAARELFEPARKFGVAGDLDASGRQGAVASARECEAEQAARRRAHAERAVALERGSDTQASGLDRDAQRRRRPSGRAGEVERDGATVEGVEARARVGIEVDRAVEHGLECAPEHGQERIRATRWREGVGHGRGFYLPAAPRRFSGAAAAFICGSASSA